jgi:hypothetical protein
MKTRMYIFCLFLVGSTITITDINAQTTSNDDVEYSVIPRGGISPATGLFGLEWKGGRYSVGVGYFQGLNISASYYIFSYKQAPDLYLTSFL